jgi:hypothetical protein
VQVNRIYRGNPERFVHRVTVTAIANGFASKHEYDTGVSNRPRSRGDRTRPPTSTRTPGSWPAQRPFHGSRGLENDYFAPTANAERDRPPNSKRRHRATDPESARRSPGNTAPQRLDAEQPDPRPVSPPSTLPCRFQG